MQSDGSNKNKGLTLAWFTTLHYLLTYLHHSSLTHTSHSVATSQPHNTLQLLYLVQWPTPLKSLQSGKTTQKTSWSLDMLQTGHMLSLSINQSGLYRIYFFPIRPEPDFAWFGMTNPAGAGAGSHIDFYFTNLMCKTSWTYEWFEFLIIFVQQLPLQLS